MRRPLKLKLALEMYRNWGLRVNPPRLRSGRGAVATGNLLEKTR